MAARQVKFETFSRYSNARVGDLHWFRIRAANGKVIAQSEGYTSKRHRDAAIELIRGTDESTPVVEAT